MSIKPDSEAESGEFVLVYKEVSDPDPETIAQVTGTLAPAEVTEIIPGTLLVRGDAKDIVQKASGIDKWTLGKEGMFSLSSP